MPPVKKPELTQQECQYLIDKTNEIATVGHQDRNNMSIVINKLVGIVGYHEGQKPSGKVPASKVPAKAAAKKK